MRIAGAALNQTPLDWAPNLANIRTALDQARAAGVELLCLPELCLTGYGCEDLFLHPWVADAAEAHLAALLPDTYGLCVVIGLPVRHGPGRAYNCAAVLCDGRILGLAAKQFLANDGIHYEPRWFQPWRAGEESEITFAGQLTRLGDLTFRHGEVEFGFEICEDAWRPDTERPACRLMGKVDLIVNPSASHFALSKTGVRHDLVINASRNFRCAYLYANLLGNEAGRVIYDGEILIARHGHLLKRNGLLSFKDVDLEWCDVDFTETLPAVSEIAALPAPDEYRELNAALSLALFDYLRKSRTKGFVLSLSGGADSAMCAIAVAEMVRLGVAELGAEEFMRKAACFTEAQTESVLALESLETRNSKLVTHLLTCAYQSTVNSSDDTYEAAYEIATSIGAEFHAWRIDDNVQRYQLTVEQALGRSLTWEADDLALQNIQARVRAPAIWLLANVKQALLLTTSNRSEVAVGYCTMDGDTAGSIAPLAGIDKDFLRRWLVWAERELGYTGLQRVNTLQPTAELRPLEDRPEDRQTDERDLMPYPVLNAIERLAFFDRLAPTEVERRLGEQHPDLTAEQRTTYVRRFYTLWSRNQWKRERYAPSFHLDDYNLDPRSWLRFPILSGGFGEELAAL
ncbi:MAG: NAD(+) synthase [Hymenobacteraceae bacterium]|nr:NAD(+) synthase [Hymenobacteraceae bacterium]